MAKHKTRADVPAKAGGPYLAAALLCERIIQDSDQTLSLIRIVDNVKFTVPPDAPPDVPSEKNPIFLEQNLFLMFRTGDAPGSHRLKLEVQLPEGRRVVAVDKDIVFTSEPHGGAHVKTLAKVGIAKAGLLWFDVFLDGKRQTRVPLNIEVERAKPPADAPKVDESTKPTKKTKRT